jgi:hypothetical protein
VKYAYNLSTREGRVREENPKFQARLGYIARHHQKFFFRKYKLIYSSQKADV